MTAGGRSRQKLPSRIDDSLPPGVAVVVPQQAWRSLLFGFEAGVFERLVQQAMAERIAAEEERVGG